MKKKFYFLLFLLILFSLSSFVKLGMAQTDDWTLTQVGGDWSYYSPSSWESPYNFTVSYFQYKKEVQNFQKWQFGVRCLDADVGGLWEISKVFHNFYAEVNSTNSDKRVIILISHTRMIHLFGLKDWNTLVLIYRDGDWECCYSGLNNLFVQVYFWRNSSDTIYLSYRLKYSPNDNECVFGEDIPFVVGSSFFNNVTLYQTVEKGLSVNTGGYIKGEKINEEITTGTGGIPNPSTEKELPLAQVIARNVWNELNQIWESFRNALPEDIRNFLDSAGQVISGFGNFLYTMFNVFWSILVDCLPILFGAYGLYLLYLIFSSLEAGDWSPLFEHFFKVGGLFISIGSTLLSVVRTIVNLIKWW